MFDFIATTFWKRNRKVISLKTLKLWVKKWKQCNIYIVNLKININSSRWILMCSGVVLSSTREKAKDLIYKKKCLVWKEKSLPYWINRSNMLLSSTLSQLPLMAAIKMCTSSSSNLIGIVSVKRTFSLSFILLLILRPMRKTTKKRKSVV